jgi:hypothetical protein
MASRAIPISFSSAIMEESLREEPRSILGAMLASWRNDWRDDLIAMKSYFDGSRRGRQWTDCECIAMGGFAADDAVKRNLKMGGRQCAWMIDSDRPPLIFT